MLLLFYHYWYYYYFRQLSRSFFQLIYLDFEIGMIISTGDFSLYNRGLEGGTKKKRGGTSAQQKRSALTLLQFPHAPFILSLSVHTLTYIRPLLAVFYYGRPFPPLNSYALGIQPGIWGGFNFRLFSFGEALRTTCFRSFGVSHLS